MGLSDREINFPLSTFPRQRVSSPTQGFLFAIKQMIEYKEIKEKVGNINFLRINKN
jgi:hypothetical protein